MKLPSRIIIPKAQCKRLACWLLVLSGTILHASVPADDRIVIGWIEKAHLPEYNLTISSKIDSGADNSSLNASGMSRFKKNGQHWIKFRLTDDIGKMSDIELPVQRYTEIKRKNAESQPRPVVKLKICLAQIEKEVEVNLVDRSNFSQQLLIGRSFLQNDFLIDVSQKYTITPSCNTESR